MAVTLEKKFTLQFNDATNQLNKVLYNFVAFSAEDRQDLFQEIRLRAWQYYPKFDQNYSFKTWIIRIATNYCITKMRSRQRRQKKLDVVSYNSLEFKEFSAIEISDESIAENSLLIDNFLLAIDSIKIVNPIYVDVLLLNILDELTPIEISKYLNLSPNTVRTRLCKGRKLLKQYFE